MLHNIVPPLHHSTPAWPTQLGRYAQKTKSHEVYGEWEMFVHPSGAVYYYNETRNTYTGLNIRDCPTDRLEKFEAWVKAMRGRVTKDRTIVAEPARIPNVDGDIYLYYLVAPEAEVIGWIEPLDGTHLFRECNSARQWNHKRLELEAQFWKHVEFFPHNFKLDHSRDVLEKIINRLASLGSDGTITEPGVVLFGHHQYLHYYGQPEARLLRSHSMGRRRRKIDYFPFIATIVMFCLPIMVRERLNQIYVDGTVNALDIKTFVDDFSSQNTAQITLAYYLDQGMTVVLVSYGPAPDSSQVPL
ncbi:hypothetical protein CY34DRAFT_104961 [Suillus luteus UH-Slu-Lm8-n1]|uniref:Uncharacterized protein n=1 Tax=Suillus luteus UH-Slu-Lm8-n1 TaxID=930992 RepID=A0A0D0BA29_9AGAM|nr:hypothetical protein CY34DRAFT_104961 [Suillus luteus UH-Slu-Lm8-n1]